MTIVITHLRLRSIWAFFSLSNNARKILKQLRSHPHDGIRTRGFGMDHYTMSAWKSKEEMQAFARSGQHLQSMKNARKFAREIRILNLERDDFPNWKEAKRLVMADGRVIRY